MRKKERLAVLIPCLNEEVTINRVVADFKAAIPEAEIYVFDNGSDDATAEIAKQAGAIVRTVPIRGKGHVVRAMFFEVEADFYLMVDGDATYPAAFAKKMLEAVRQGQCDMAVGRRRPQEGAEAFPKFHRFGNAMVAKAINFTFKSRLKDVFSGYRAFSRNVVKMLPLLSKGFEVETELSLQALDKGYTIEEIEVPYYARPEGSSSKLNTFVDGFLVLRTILSIMKDYRPLMVFSFLALACLILSLGFGFVVISEFIHTGFVNHPSTAVLAAALMIFSLLSLATGLILDTIKRHFAEFFMLQRIHRKHSGEGFKGE